MGDRTYLSFRFRREDAAAVYEEMIGGKTDSIEDQFEEEDYMLRHEDHDANYGALDERLKLAERGVVFEGFHHSGGCYGASLFVGINGKLIQADSTEGDSMCEPALTMSRDGLVVGQEAAMAYWAALAEFENLVQPPLADSHLISIALERFVAGYGDHPLQKQVRDLLARQKEEA